MLPEATELTYRQPKEVTKIILFENDDCFPVCPRCNISLEREYMNYCDYCGQRLEWNNYSAAVLITDKEIK